MVSGPPAGGRSELLHAFCDHVLGSGALLLMAGGSRSERAVRLGVFSQLVHNAPLPPDIIRRVAEAVVDPAFAPERAGKPEWREWQGEPAGRAEPERPAVSLPAPGAAPSRRPGTGVIREACEALLKLAEHRTVVLAVDDLHFVDEESLRALLYLRLCVRPARTLLLFTEWPDVWCAPSASSALRAELTAPPYRRIRLAPLTRDGVARLVARSLGPARAARCAAAYHRLTGGNPTLVRALIEDDTAAGDPGGPPAVGEAFDRAVLACLHRWDPALAGLARSVALLGPRASAPLVGELLNSPPALVARGLAALGEAGLLEAGRFRHPAVAAAVLKDLAPAEAARLRARTAGLLYHHGAVAEEVADHLVAGGGAPGPWAVAPLREAARRALVVNDDARLAAEYLSLARRSCRDERERASVTAELAMARWRTNPSAAIRLTPLRDALSHPGPSERDMPVVVRNLLWRGDHGEAEKALALLHGGNGRLDAQTAAEIDLTYQWIYGPRPAAPGRATPTGPAAADPWTRAAAVLGARLHTWRRDELAESAWHLLRGSRLSETSLGVLATGLIALTYADELDRAVSWCDGLVAEAVRRRAPAWRAMLGSVRADLALRQGDPAAAKAYARRALDLARAQGWGVLVGYPLATLVLAATATGAYEEAYAELEQMSPDHTFETVFGLRYLHARGHLHLATGGVLAAYTDFTRCGDLMREWEIDIPALVPWRGDLAQAQLRLGNREAARDLVTAQLARPGAIGARLRGISRRILAATAGRGERVPLLREAVADLRAAGDRLELARALADLGRARHEAGDPGRARPAAPGAVEETRAAGPPDFLGLVREPGARPRPPARPGLPDERLAALSDAELRVAAQAALGYTNREIGSRLHITPSTVEQHLTRVYRKLRIGGRRHLPAGLLPPSPAAGERRAG
ncbi:DNA-binding CsgD family transcriptional regulator [Streptomyces eurocidicus]|uniref:DNA-binding CsgD family transcriptional regulator n=1 Tax=Streptomyces eurocidicus TaxID=66423 RepID=A0A7W8BGQ7_STREU|nr:DNA-binding CsgD family transcriptional regulator [Streptomyces eurocidicus]